MKYHVTLQPSGKSFDVDAGEKILNAGLDAGVSLPYSCRMGLCSSCCGHIVEGKVDVGDVLPAYLTPQMRAEGKALLCQARALSDLVVEIHELPKLVPPQRFPAIVKRCTPVADDVAVIDLRLPLHQYLMYAAGQYVDLLLPDGQRRSYSIATPPKVPEGVIDLQLHIRHLPGGVFTDHLFNDGLKPREKFQIEGPLGTFFLREESDKPIVMVASGTGYAPIRSILLDMFRRDIARPVTLYWGGRKRADLYAMEEALRFAEEHGHFHFVPVLSEAAAADAWNGRTGFVHRAVMEDVPDLSAYQVYACGAPVMVSAARTDFVAQCGLPDAEFFADSFISQADIAVAA